MSAGAVRVGSVRVGAGAVVVRDDALLLVRHTYGWAQGRWLLPNGGQQSGETLADCAVRELREETGLSGIAGRLVAVRSLASVLGSDTFVALEVEVATGEPRPDGKETDGAQFFRAAVIGEMFERGEVVRLHRLIAAHVLSDPDQQAIQTLPALDRDGNPATSTIYLL